MKRSPETIKPYEGTEAKEVQIKEMFETIAGRYDRMNRILSFGIDRRWRDRGLRYLTPFAPMSVLDIASGTGDLALLLAQRLKPQPQQVIGADLSQQMMAIGEKKAAKAALSDRLTFEYQDCLALTYPDHSFDAVTVAFGIRNFSDIRKGIEEMFRVLKPQGHLMILELTMPETFPMKQLFRLYSSCVMPLVGRLFGVDRAAYRYLPTSIRSMPQGREMVALLEKCGFVHAAVHSLTGGICSMYVGRKQ